jgi:hypothetical protein
VSVAILLERLQHGPTRDSTPDSSFDHALRTEMSCEAPGDTRERRVGIVPATVGASPNSESLFE